VADRLTEERVITQGGWHPRYARVLLIQEVGEEAIVLVDGNGDGADVEREQWFLTDEGWAAGPSGGVGAFDRRPLWTWGSIGAASYVIGCAEPGASVGVEWLDSAQRATANELGVWVCVFPGQPAQRPTGVPNNSFRAFTPGESATVSLDRPRIIESA
jgi:hypothetical protein